MVNHPLVLRYDHAYVFPLWHSEARQLRNFSTLQMQPNIILFNFIMTVKFELLTCFPAMKNIVVKYTCRRTLTNVLKKLKSVGRIWGV